MAWWVGCGTLDVASRPGAVEEGDLASMSVNINHARLALLPFPQFSAAIVRREADDGKVWSGIYKFIHFSSEAFSINEPSCFHLKSVFHVTLRL